MRSAVIVNAAVKDTTKHSLLLRPVFAKTTGVFTSLIRICWPYKKLEQSIAQEISLLHFMAILGVKGCMQYVFFSTSHP